jgi:hypothetical protein
MWIFAELMRELDDDFGSSSMEFLILFASNTQNQWLPAYIARQISLLENNFGYQNAIELIQTCSKVKQRKILLLLSQKLSDETVTDLNIKDVDTILNLSECFLLDDEISYQLYNLGFSAWPLRLQVSFPRN